VSAASPLIVSGFGLAVGNRLALAMCVVVAAMQHSGDAEGADQLHR